MYTVPGPICPQAIPVRVGGVGVGSLPSPLEPGREDPRSFLLDVSGRRCYEFTEVPYVRFQIGPGSRYKSMRLSGRRLYRLSHPVDDFLEESPTTVTVSEVYGYGVYNRYQLLSVLCTAG